MKPDELVPLPGDLALEKVRAIRRSAKERVFVTNALRALRRQSNRQHSRYSVRGAGRRLVAGFRSSAAGHRCAGALPPGRRARKYSRQRRPKKRGGHRPDSLGTRSLRMDSNHSAPAIVITVINDCASLWHEVLLGIEEEGIPFLLQHHPAGDVVDSAGRRRAARRCWLALPAIDTRWSCITRIYPHRRRFYADASSGQSGPSQYR